MQVVVGFEQVGDQFVAFPVTVTLTYSAGRSSTVMVPVTDMLVERAIPAGCHVCNFQF